MASKKAYVVNHTKRIVTIDDTVTMTVADQKDLDFYAKAGYIVKHKNQVRARQAKQRAIDNGTYTIEQIRDALKTNPDALKTFEERCKKGYFSGVKYYKELLAIAQYREYLSDDKESLKTFEELAKYSFSACEKFMNDWIRKDMAKDSKALKEFEEKCKKSFASGIKYYNEWVQKKKTKASSVKSEMDK